ncbi:prolipoprotein diacylglyceryl transferase family protein [Bordetella avium]|uniref:TlpA disulfide reductase family protein n=1 Tax=Bordetella avium TaxID=521 RepID=UPI000E68A558|nr:TlpA disulfide reductase family protein [Bordetella avium]AZY50061.1 redoxin [Bordetella avium]AZY53426.1 redoxin [Bordetella avium]RIQ17418.1 TlpA family protein disulfide reductase [Bordetella avium]RIQ33905.1 TlpA family protein disulfide reductase [Bordetella avium]RIQ68641.1 TlpA family protein disulfide reductase [Bordetella avium]
MTGIGPYSFEVIFFFAAVLIAWVTARLAARKVPGSVHGLLLDAVFWGAVAARLVYVAMWWPDYAASPRSIVSLSDGGFSWWAGVCVALALVWWKTRSSRALRAPLLSGLAAGVVVWFAAAGVLQQLRTQAPPLPDVALHALDGQSVSLDAYLGKPVVLNLWASWCPPCRREMPVLQQAQAEFPQVNFVLINQGESAQHIRDFLGREHLEFKDMLLDPASRMMHAMGARGLPATLFFDAQGRLVDTHLGELTMATLKHTLSRRFSFSSPSHTE